MDGLTGVAKRQACRRRIPNLGYRLRFLAALGDRLDEQCDELMQVCHLRLFGKEIQSARDVGNSLGIYSLSSIGQAAVIVGTTVTWGTMQGLGKGDHCRPVLLMLERCQALLIPITGEASQGSDELRTFF
jgi:hypothetical protein